MQSIPTIHYFKTLGILLALLSGLAINSTVFAQEDGEEKQNNTTVITIDEDDDDDKPKLKWYQYFKFWDFINWKRISIRHIATRGQKIKHTKQLDTLRVLLTKHPPDSAYIGPVMRGHMRIGKMRNLSKKKEHEILKQLLYQNEVTISVLGTRIKPPMENPYVLMLFYPDEKLRLVGNYYLTIADGPIKIYDPTGEHCIEYVFFHKNRPITEPKRKAKRERRYYKKWNVEKPPKVVVREWDPELQEVVIPEEEREKEIPARKIRLPLPGERDKEAEKRQKEEEERLAKEEALRKQTTIMTEDDDEEEDEESGRKKKKNKKLKKRATLDAEDEDEEDDDEDD